MAYDNYKDYRSSQSYTGFGNNFGGMGLRNYSENEDTPTEILQSKFERPDSDYNYKSQATGFFNNPNKVEEEQKSKTSLNWLGENSRRRPTNNNLNAFSTTNNIPEKTKDDITKRSTQDLRRGVSSGNTGLNFGRSKDNNASINDKSLQKINEEEELINNQLGNVNRRTSWMNVVPSQSKDPQIPKYISQKSNQNPTYLYNNKTENLEKKSFSVNQNFGITQKDILDKSNFTENKDLKEDPENSYFKNDLIRDDIESNFKNLREEKDGILTNIKHTGNYMKDNVFLDDNKQDINELNLKLQEYEKEIYKLKLEKESLEESNKNIKNQIKEDKKRFEDILNEQDKNFKKINSENEAIISAIKIRNKEEMNSMEERYKLYIKDLNKDKESLKNTLEEQLKKALENEKNISKMEIEKNEKLFILEKQQIKLSYEEQIDSLKRQINQNLNFDKLANKMETSSKQIDNIIGKFNEENQEKSKLYQNVSVAKDAFLSEYESKLKYLESELAKERDRLAKLSKDQEISLLERKREIQEERNRMDKENLRLQELQSAIKSLEFQSIQKYESEKLSLSNKEMEFKHEIDNIKNEFKHKLSELEHQKKIFYDEKIFFEKYKDEIMRNVETRKKELELKREKFIEEEREIKSRIKVLQEKEYYINDLLTYDCAE